jgi:nitrite reductase/ring-hydroxylating ferredoxin subunit
VVSLTGERVAVFRYDGRISAISNVCQHQNGPLGEGKILDGCVTCPWHGYQYRPADGASPPPFQERVPTFRVRVEDGRIFVDPRPLPPGTFVEPAVFDAATPAREDREAFFVGYLPFPERLKRFHRTAAAALALLFVAVGLIVGGVQRPLGAGEFEFGVESRLEGVLRLEPVPSIWIASEPGGLARGPVTAVPLVGAGKHGPAPEVVAFAGREVSATGSWIRRGSERLFEIARAEIVTGGSTAAPGPVERLPLGRARLAGEIVDSKCWLGVMKPGEGKSHKACAIRCLSGGSPAAFVARSDRGEVAVLWLVSAAGEPLGRELLDVTAEPVEIDGELVRVGGRSLLVTSRAAVRRLD